MKLCLRFSKPGYPCLPGLLMNVLSSFKLSTMARMSLKGLRRRVFLTPIIKALINRVSSVANLLNYVSYFHIVVIDIKKF